MSRRAVCEKHKYGSVQLRKQTQVVARGEKKVAQAATQLERLQDRLERHQNEQEALESRRRIFKHDVELDSVFSV